MNTEHENCGGHFKEMSLYDDWEGKLTCDKCGYRTVYQRLDSGSDKTEVDGSTPSRPTC